MSRTHKDAPRRVKETRLGIADKKAGCSLCEENSLQTVLFGFSAIFFAHEVQQKEDFIALAEEKGYEAEEREVRGYLGDASPAFESYTRERRIKEFAGSFEERRAIYSAPDGVDENILWNSSGPRTEGTKTRKAQLRGLIGSRDESMMDRIFSSKNWVSHKENIFTVVSVFREYPRGRGFYHYHESGATGYLLAGHCHCSYCEPDEKAEKTRVRSLTSKLRNAFNSGSYDELDEIASELVRTGSGAYRDVMNC